MYQAVITKFFGPGNVRGARIKASAVAGHVWHEYTYELSADGNHQAAARKLIEKYGWGGNWHEGGMPDGNRCYVNSTDSFVFVTEQKR